MSTLTKSENRRNLGVWDAELQKADRINQAYEAYQDECVRYCEQELRHAVFVEGDRSVANYEAQLGKPLDWKVLKTFIEKNPRLKVEPHPFKPEIFCIYQIVESKPWDRNYETGGWGGTQKRYLMSGERMSPEWTIMSVKEVIQPSNERKIDAPLKKTKIPWRVDKQGWRALLARLVTLGLIPIGEVEQFTRIHGSEDRLGWAAALGKTSERAKIA